MLSDYNIGRARDRPRRIPPRLETAEVFHKFRLSLQPVREGLPGFSPNIMFHVHVYAAFVRDLI